MRTHPLKVAGLVFPGFELLDLFGPLELYGLLEERVRISIVAEETGLVESHQGPRLVAEVPFNPAGSVDVLLVPGGLGTRHQINNVNFLVALRAWAANARYVTSVCTGSMLLARAGLLDGRQATSNKRLFDVVATQGPGVRWVLNRALDRGRQLLHLVGRFGRNGHDARRDSARIWPVCRIGDRPTGGIRLARRQHVRSVCGAGWHGRAGSARPDTCRWGR